MPGSLTTPGRPALAMTRSDVLPSTICTVSAPRIGLFCGSMAGLCAPLSTLRRDHRGPLRMTRGRCGSLLLHRKGLAPSTPSRSPGAFAPEAMAECIRNGGVWEAESNIDLLALVSILAAADRDASFTVKCINL
jgi:hypothetical protein